MKIVITACLILFTMSVKAQELNKKMMDKSRNKEVLINNCTRDSLIAFPEFKQSYDPNYASYNPDSADVAVLKKLAKGNNITIVLGTWCGDSKMQVPHFYKILDAAKINTGNVILIAVDGSKHAENGLIDSLKIERVPTFIFTDKNGKELGRITEYPKKTLEADMREILSAAK